MKTLAVALLLTVTLLVGPSSAGAADTDASAIASFLSIGLANAPTNFIAIRGGQIGPAKSVTRYKATNPDRTHFVTCVTSQVEGFPEYKIPEDYVYSCTSTPRSDSPAALFEMAEPAVRASLPVGYSSQGAVRDRDQPYEIWKRSGSPNVRLLVYAGQRGTYYELEFTVNP